MRGSLIETLEGRRLFAVNIHPHPVTTNTPNVVVPGGTFELPVEIENHGTTTASGSFVVGARFVPVSLTDWFLDTSSYEGAGFIEVGAKTHASGVPAGDHVIVNVTVSVPSNIEAGLYALVVRCDANNSIAEDNEADNDDVAIAIAALDSTGLFAINGTNIDETFRMSQATVGGKKAVSFKADQGALTFRTGAIAVFKVRTLEGDDTFIVDGVFAGVTIDAGDGNDRIAGNEGSETLVGGAGKDTIDGGGGNDRLNGNGGHDKLLGNTGADRLYGYDGNDYLDGGSSNDRLEGGNGTDVFFGQGQNDRFFSADGVIEDLFGGSGSDSATADDDDVLSSIESAVTI